MVKKHDAIIIFSNPGVHLKYQTCAIMTCFLNETNLDYKPWILQKNVITIGVPITNWLSDNKVKQLDYTNSIVSMANVYLNSD